MPAPTSRLLALPRELRDVIYSYFLDTDALISSKISQPTTASLCLTNKQLHAETLELYYTLSHFDGYDRWAFKRWYLQHPKRDKLKNLKMYCVVENGMDDLTKAKAMFRQCERQLFDCVPAKFEFVEEKDLPEGVDAGQIFKVSNEEFMSRAQAFGAKNHMRQLERKMMNVQEKGDSRFNLKS